MPSMDLSAPNLFALPTHLPASKSATASPFAFDHQNHVPGTIFLSFALHHAAESYQLVVWRGVHAAAGRRLDQRSPAVRFRPDEVHAHVLPAELFEMQRVLQVDDGEFRLAIGKYVELLNYLAVRFRLGFVDGLQDGGFLGGVDSPLLLSRGRDGDVSFPARTRI